MADRASDQLTAQQPPSPRASVEAVEADIARTRERLAMTLTALNTEVRALLDPDTPLTLPPVGTRDIADRVAAGLRTTAQISALARTRKSGPLGILTAVTGLTVFVLRSGIARRMWNRNRDRHVTSGGSSPV